MGGKRTLIVVAAVLAAAVAAFANYAYLNSVQDRAYKNAKLLQVFVVSKDILRGLPGDQALTEEFVKSDEIPREFRPATSITDVATIRGKVALSNLSVGQVVVDGMFVDPRQAQVTFAQSIPAGQVAITIQVDQVRGVAGLLVPGDRVNLLINDGGVERHLFENVPIIAIGNTAAPLAGEAPASNPGSGLITFAVPPDDSARIALAAERGGIYLTLVPPDNPSVSPPDIGAADLFSGSPTP